MMTMHQSMPIGCQAFGPIRPVFLALVVVGFGLAAGSCNDPDIIKNWSSPTELEYKRTEAIYKYDVMRKGTKLGSKRKNWLERTIITDIAEGCIKYAKNRCISEDATLKNGCNWSGVMKICTTTRLILPKGEKKARFYLEITQNFPKDERENYLRKHEALTALGVTTAHHKMDTFRVRFKTKEDRDALFIAVWYIINKLRADAGESSLKFKDVTTSYTQSGRRRMSQTETCLSPMLDQSEQ